MIKLNKAALSEDVFTTPIEAVTRAIALGLGPQAHETDLEDGQVAYMPAASHDLYLEARGADVVDPSSTEDAIECPTFADAVAAILAAVTKRAQPDGVILKADDEERMVWGWASISTVNGELVTDKQDDQIEPSVMEKMATGFMQSQRMAKAMHEGDGIGEVIHSLPLTKQISELLGVYSPIEGWIVAIKVHDDAVWSRVKSGELRAFSIGGKGKRNAT